MLESEGQDRSFARVPAREGEAIAGGVVRRIVCPGSGEMTRKETDALAGEIKGIGAGGLSLAKVTADGQATSGGGVRVPLSVDEVFRDVSFPFNTPERLSFPAAAARQIASATMRLATRWHYLYEKGVRRRACTGGSVSKGVKNRSDTCLRDGALARIAGAQKQDEQC